MLVLSQFVLRLSFGLSLAMALTSPKKVTSGYFRNHSYVLLGLTVLATLAAVANQSSSVRLVVWAPLAAAFVSYLSAAAWLYEKARIGTAFLYLVAGLALIGTWSDFAVKSLPSAAIADQTSNSFDATGANQNGTAAAKALTVAEPVTNGLLLGSTIAAMFLGHWYLNTPTMELEPLRKLLVLMAVAVVAEAVVSGISLALELQLPWLEPSQYPLLALHWLAGIIGTAVLTWMAWQTLKIPNTQSATGILYVAVITTFIGELSSLLLSGGTGYPV